MEVNEATDHYRSHFARCETELVHNGESWTRPLREAAFSRFAELGFPSTRDEEWKYTNIGPILRIPFAPAASEVSGWTCDRLASVAFGDLERNRIVFLNGYHSDQFSALHSLPRGVKVGSLALALRAEAGLVQDYLGHHASYRDHTFVALNTALMRDGAFVYVPKGVVVEEPIHLLFVARAGSEAAVSHPRSLIVVGDGGQVTLLESYVGLEGGIYFTNAVTEMVLGENAVVEHCKLQWESLAGYHIAMLQASVRRSSNFLSHSIALGGSLTRNEVNVVLDGEGGECTLNGLYMAEGQQHMDNHTRIDHVKPHCTSREYYKGILDGQSRGVFNGKIYVHRNAEKTDAKQTNKNLLLSKNAWVDTKPQLEIYNNDVKCTHGSAIGQIDQDALFYLRSRGLDREAAQGLLTYAFASEVIRGIRVESVRAWLDNLLVSRPRKGSPTRETL